MKRLRKKRGSKLLEDSVEDSAEDEDEERWGRWRAKMRAMMKRLRKKRGSKLLEDSVEDSAEDEDEFAITGSLLLAAKLAPLVYDAAKMAGRTRAGRRAGRHISRGLRSA